MVADFFCLGFIAEILLLVFCLGFIDEILLQWWLNFSGMVCGSACGYMFDMGGGWVVGRCVWMNFSLLFLSF